MAVIGQINTIVSATTKPLTGALGRAGGALQSFGGRVSGMVGGIGRLGGALAAAAGASGFGLMVKSSFDTIDSLAKTADSLGITTEALAGLRRAGERSGVESEKLDKGIARMQRTISAASIGLVSASKNFDQLGLSVEHIRSLSPEEQFLQVADAINKIPDQTDKTRIAMETFGRDGTSILKLLGKGADAARAELEKAAALGLAPSREDAALIEAANDAIADMKDSFVGIANTVAISIAPAIKNISDGVQAFGIRARTAVSGVTPILRQFGNFWSTIFSQAWETASIVFELLGFSGKTTFSSLMDSVLNFFIGAEFAFKNIGPIAELLWEKLKLGALTFWEDTKFLFTTQLPEAVKWFADNFGDIFFTAVDYVVTIFENLGKNITAIWQAVLDFFSGSEFNIDWTPLTEGFVSQIKEMPQISERELTEVEKIMTNRVNNLGQNLSADLAKFTAERRAELLPPETKVEVSPEVSADLGASIGESVDMGIKGAVEGPQALQKGSAEAFSAILASQRNQNDPMESVAKTSEKSLNVEQNILTTLKNIERFQGTGLLPGEI